MRLVIQRVREASVKVGEREAARIGPGLLVLVGFSQRDKHTDLPTIAKTLIDMRVFDDAQGRMNRSISQIGGEVLVVPEITLVASLDKGKRPGFDDAAPPADAEAMFAAFVHSLRAIYSKVSAGVFQAHMILRLVNDGPVTFVLDDAVR